MEGSCWAAAAGLGTAASDVGDRRGVALDLSIDDASTKLGAAGGTALPVAIDAVDGAGLTTLAAGLATWAV